MNSNNSRDGKEYLSFLLDNFTNSNISSLTKSTESFRLKKSCCSLIGGLQKQFLGILFTPKLLSAGFVDRLLCVNLIEANNKLSKQKISMKKVNRYNQSINNILEYKVQSEKPEEENKRFEIRFTNEAQDKLFEFSQKIEDMKENSKSPLKEYLGKSSIYLHKLCIVVFLINRAEDKCFKKYLEATEVELAFELVEFFILNFKSILKTNKERQVSREDVIWLAKKNNAKQKAVVEITGYSKSQVSKIWNRI